MQSNLCTETFNLNDLDQAAISERAYTEFQKIKAYGGRTKEMVLYHCNVGQGAEIYLMHKCGYKDNTEDYQDLFKPCGVVPVEVKVTMKGHPETDTDGCIQGIMDHIDGTKNKVGIDERRFGWNKVVADKVYFYHFNPTTGNYTFLCTAHANKLLNRYVLDAENVL